MVWKRPYEQAKVIEQSKKRQPSSLVRAIGFVLLTNGMKQEFYPDFLIIPYQLVENEFLTPADLKVYGAIYWYQHLKDGKCTAGNPAIARIARIKARTIRECLERLEKHGFIQRIYKDTEKKIRQEIMATIAYRRVGATAPGVGATAPTEVGAPAPYINNNYKKNKNHTLAAHSAANDRIGSIIQPIIEKFKSVNPSFERLYRNKTQRSALERLVQKYGVTKTEGAIKMASLVAGKKYAPVITTPLELEEKLGKLVHYYKRENERGAMLVKL